MSSLGLEDAIVHKEILTEFTQKALNDSNQAIKVLNSGVKTMRKTILQNHMALNNHLAFQGGTCAVIQIECYFCF